MTNLNISIGGSGIGITLPAGNISISVAENNQMPQNLVSGSVKKLKWSDTLLDGKRVDFEAGNKAISELKPAGEGWGEWRYPTREELCSILDLNRHDPAINTDEFPETKSEPYWTSTPCAWNAAAVWVVLFSGGYVHGYDRSGLACVRAVCSSQ